LNCKAPGFTRKPHAAYCTKVFQHELRNDPPRGITWRERKNRSKYKLPGPCFSDATITDAEKKFAPGRHRQKARDPIVPPPKRASVGMDERSAPKHPTFEADSPNFSYACGKVSKAKVILAAFAAEKVTSFPFEA